MNKSFYISFLIAFVATSTCIAQQNLVLNPSFEDTISCPFGPGEVIKSNNWASYRGSPDYMNSCNSDMVSVPNNWGGYQQAASGNAYAAFATYATKIINNNAREFVGGKLYSPLTIGTKYFVSFKVALSLDVDLQANCASSKLGAAFSTVPHNEFNPAPINNDPQVYTNAIITDTLNWTRIFGSFVSDSVYQYVMIGNFFDDNNTDTLILDGDTWCNASYYFLDDICVSTDSLYTAQYNYVGVDLGRIESCFKIYPNPASYLTTIENPFHEPYSLKVMNGLGQTLLEIAKIEDQKFKLDISSLENGLLHLVIQNKNKQIKCKLIKIVN